MYTNKKFASIITGAAVLTLVLFNSACDRESGPAVEENITTIVVHLTGANFDKEFTWEDTDGDGVANTLDTITVPASTGNLACHLHVYDRSATPEIDLSEEIEGESTEHLFVYTVNPANLVTVGSLNTDTNNAPFGIESLWQTGTAGSGTVNLKLYHEPTNKNDSANPGGTVDFDVTFPVKVQ